MKRFWFPLALPAEGQEFNPIVFVNLANTGSQDWNISDMYSEGDYVLGTTSYVSVPVTNLISDESDTTFRIIKPVWPTYANTKFGYSVAYPNDWTSREFPGTQTGTGFRPLSSPNENEKVVQTVNDQLKYKTVQIILNDKSCEDTYDRMLATFKRSE
jgi:hypothetical protein